MEALRLMTPGILSLILLHVGDAKLMLMMLLCMKENEWEDFSSFKEVLDITPLEAWDYDNIVYYTRHNLRISYNLSGQHIDTNGYDLAISTNICEFLLCLKSGEIETFKSKSGALRSVNYGVLVFAKGYDNVYIEKRQSRHRIRNGVILPGFTPNDELVWGANQGLYIFGKWPENEPIPKFREEIPEIITTFTPHRLMTPANPIFLEFYERFCQLIVLAHDFAQQKVESPVFLEDHALQTAARDIAAAFDQAIRVKN